MRFYTTPNIFEIQAGVTVTASAPEKSVDYAVSNLVNNMGNRSSGNDLFPLSDSGNNIGTPALHRSCYKTTNNQIVNNKLKIEFDLQVTWF